MLDPDKPILLVLENEDDLDEVVRLFIRTGYSKFAGYLVGGMKAWDAAGYPNAEIGQMTVHELNKRKADLQNCRCSFSARMEERACSRCASHFFAGTAKTDGRAGSRETDGGLLRERLSRQHRGEHFERGRFRESLECPGKLGSVEESEVSRWKKKTANEWDCNPHLRFAPSPPSFGQTMRPDVWWTQPLLVFLGLRNFHRLFNVGGVSGRALLFRQLRFAVLFAGTFR